MKTLRRFFWLFSALFHRHRRVILGTFFGGVIVFIFALRGAPFVWSELNKDHTMIGMVGSYTPSNLPLSIQRLISTGLTDVTPEGEAKPALATEWSRSEDGKEYTFMLKDGIVWHDGKSFGAFDINYNLKDVEFLAVDDRTLKVKLKEAFTPLPTFLSKPLFRKGLLGVGSYKLGTIKLKGEFVQYVQLIPLSPDLPLIEIKFYPSETLAKTAFKLGEVNMLDELIDQSDFEEWATIDIREVPKYNQYVGVFFNTEDELLKEKEVRQALSFAIEKGETNRVAGPISLISWGYTNRVKQYEKDDTQAKTLLGDAGEGKTLTLSTFPQYLHLAQTIAASWTAVGMPTKVKVEDSVPENYQALLATQEIPTDPDQYTLWHSTQGDTNITRYANPKIDKLLEDGRKEADIEERKKIYAEFQRYLVDDAPAVFLFHPTTYTVKRK